MSHAEQRAFCEWVKGLFPKFFAGNVHVLDCGSLDINGNNRYLFGPTVRYYGMDLVAGPNVDFVGRVHDYHGPAVDCIISTEMLEHDEFYQASLRAMVRSLLPGGLLVFTCATTGRPEHGTSGTTPTDSPATLDYYRNLTDDDIAAIPGFLAAFSEYQFFVEDNHKDLCFYGIKRQSN